MKLKDFKEVEKEVRRVFKDKPTIKIDILKHMESCKDLSFALKDKKIVTKV